MMIETNVRIKFACGICWILREVMIIETDVRIDFADGICYSLACEKEEDDDWNQC